MIETGEREVMTLRNKLRQADRVARRLENIVQAPQFYMLWPKTWECAIDELSDYWEDDIDY